MLRIYFVISIIFLITGCQEDEGKRVLLIGVDGLQYEQMLSISTPNFDRLNITKAYAGGVVGTGSEQPTSSGPGWATLLTGVWANKHQVWSNELFIADYRYPSVMFRIKQAIPSLSLSSVMHWIVPYFVFFVQEVPSLRYLSFGVDEEVTRKVMNQISEKRSDVVFVHLDAPDHAGHAYGFSEQHTEAVIETDRLVGKLLDVVEQRELNNPEEDWLILLITDHGREPDVGFNHGAQTLEEKTVFIGTNKVEMNDAFRYQKQGVLDTAFEGLYGYPSQADIAPTVFRHLGIPVSESWKLDGVPLIGEFGIMRLMSHVDQANSTVVLQWINNDAMNRNIEIERNGELIAVLLPGETRYIDESADDSVIDYLVRVGGMASHIRVNAGAQ